MAGPGRPYEPWLWPLDAAVRIGAATLSSLEDLLRAGDAAGRPPEPAWTTSNRVLLEWPAVRVHEFGDGAGPAVILVAPFALHGPVLADLAPGNSLIERLLSDKVGRLLLIECRSAAEQTRGLGIDDYLAALLVVVEDLGGAAALVGLCQGGWLSLMFAARFPSKVSRLLLVGSPIDLDAGGSRMVAATRNTPPEFFETLVESGAGIVRGRSIQGLWGGHDLERGVISDVLQDPRPSPDLLDRFRAWHAWTVDLPGPYYLQTVEDLFRRNKLAKGEFVALGRTLDLSRVQAPLALMTADRDEVTPPAQVLAARRLVGTPPAKIRTLPAEGAHLSLFMGARNLATVWREAARWLKR